MKFDKHNLNAKIEKCQFFKSSIELLGHLITATGIQVLNDKVKAVRKSHIPENVQQLRSYRFLD